MIFTDNMNGFSDSTVTVTASANCSVNRVLITKNGMVIDPPEMCSACTMDCGNCSYAELDTEPDGTTKNRRERRGNRGKVGKWAKR